MGVGYRCAREGFHKRTYPEPRRGLTTTVSTPASPAPYDADVIVVGAGPAGSATAYHLARQGLDVLVLEKTAFPREKVCGDGLTPRAVKQLVAMGVDTSPASGWARNIGLRIISGGRTLHMRWPDLSTFPDYGLTRTRKDFDEVLAGRATAAGARIQQRTTVTGPVRHDRTGRIEGVTAKHDGTTTTYRAQLVVAADGNSSRLGVQAGRERLDNRPMGVAVRTYYESPTSRDELAREPSRALGRRQAAPRLRLDLRRSATAPSTSGSASSTPARRSARSTTRRC